MFAYKEVGDVVADINEAIRYMRQGRTAAAHTKLIAVVLGLDGQPPPDVQIPAPPENPDTTRGA